MTLSSIHPQPEATTAKPCVATSTVTQETSIYEDDSTGPLPVINVTRTLAGKLCGRVDDAAFNERIISLTQRADPYLHGVASIFLGSCLSLFFVANVPARTAMSYLNAVTGMLVLIHGFASLSWDMLRLVLGTFEFWFLYFINTTNNIWFNMLFHDHRMAAMLVTGASFVLSLCADANIYTRRFATRLLVIASPGLLFGIAATAFHFPPDLHYRKFDVLGLRIDAIDLLVNGNLIITYFTAIRVARSQHLVLPRGPIGRITCDLYFPVCHLVPHMRRRFTMRSGLIDPRNVTAKAPVEVKQQIELVHNSESTQGIHASHVLFPRLASWTHRSFGRMLPGFGVLGLSASLVAFLWRLGEVAVAPQSHANRAFPLAVVGLAASMLFVLTYLAHAQRTLAARIVREIDAWFVSFQLSMVTVAACDVLAWDPRRVLLIASAWVWGHWLLFLDALPPITRRRLRYSNWLTLAVTAVLLVYPVLLGYWFYFSPARPQLRNRVVLNVEFSEGVNLRVDVLGFLASKLFTLGAWMGRFFWREMRRPRDAFKLLKHRVFYRVHV